MHWILQNLALPLILSVVAALVVHYIHKYAIVWGRLSFFGYPSISGRWVATYLDSEYKREEVDLQQVGSRLSGVVRDSLNNKTDFELIGSITRTRYIIYQFKAKDTTLNSCGVAFFKLSKSGSEADGFFVFPDTDEQPNSYRAHLTKIA